MNVTKQLHEEHLIIRDFLDQLQIAADRIVENRVPDKMFFEDAVRFARDFTDKYHHYKEEMVMFTRLAQLHTGLIDAETERLRSQHEQGRNHIAEISSLTGLLENPVQDNLRKLRLNLLEYIKLMRSHLNLENLSFFPMVESTLSDDDKLMILEEFKTSEQKLGEHFYDNSSKLLTEMKQILNE
ncbi:hemerythrin domain-containing protein [bacterium]|nr:hemerythrin domain-containing protein [bacterium]